MIDNIDKLKQLIREVVKEEITKSLEEKADTESIILYSNEIITEEKVYNKGNFYLGIFPTYGRNFSDDPYFKVSYTSNFSKSARIYMSRPQYAYHENFTLELSRKRISQLVDILKSAPITDKYQGSTIWEQLVYICLKNRCDEYKLSEAEKVEYINRFSIIPDYNLGIAPDSSGKPIKERW